MGLVDQNIDIFCIAETKIDSACPTDQFVAPGYHKPFRIDGPKVREASGGLLVYVKDNIPAKLLNIQLKLPENCQALPIELNFRKQKWLFVPIYRPETFNKSRFVDSISNVLDFYTKSYDNFLVVGDMNMEASDLEMTPLTKGHNLYSMIRSPTCFRNPKGRCIDLILTNKKYSFMHLLQIRRMIFTI